MTETDNKDKIVETFFSHDKAARADEKIVKMFYTFRKNKNKYTDESNLICHAAYGVYWEVVEYMHRNSLAVDELEMLSDELRVDYDFLFSIMNNFGLFRQENGYYVSDRINRNLEFQQNKTKEKSKAANKRWALKTLNSVYTEIFEENPNLNKDEINSFIEYYLTIPDFKNKLPDILYTTKTLKFDNIPNFKGSISWLLEGNHLTKMLNGGYGKIRSWQNHKEWLKNKNTAPEPEAPETYIPVFDSKAEALEYIVNRTKDKTFRIITPDCKQLMQKFDITVKELRSGND